MRIGIAGVGGIGSNVAVHLVRSGITDLVLVDFDRVEQSNLNRQFYFHDQIGEPKVSALANNLQRICPELLLQCLTLRLDADNILATFKDCDVVVEGFDRQKDKKMLIEQLGSSIRIVSASGIAGSALDTLGRREIGQCTIFGDHLTDCRNAQLFSHKVAAVACFMSEYILKYRNGESDHEKT